MEDEKLKQNTTSGNDVIDLREVLHTVTSRKRLFIWVWIVTIAVSAFIIFPIPRYYTSSVKLAPEAGNGSGSSLGALVSTFGVDIGGDAGSDAIYPMLYPDLLGSYDFVLGLMDVPIKTIDGEVNTDYFDYLKNHQQQTFYKIPLNWIRKQIAEMTKTQSATIEAGEGEKLTPFRMSKAQKDIADLIISNTKCNVDMKTQVISITLTDQDPLVCATMVDSIREHLQNFIIEYRTSKASNDVVYYEKLVEEARLAYEESMKQYSAFCDANRDIILQSAISKRDELENNIQLNLNKYNTTTAQLEAAKAKLQERIPAFTILESSTIPLKPAGPKRVIFIIAMLMLTTIGTGIYLLRKQIVDLLLSAR